MSAVGGALSLYLGISIAMFFEIIELLIDFCINSCLHFGRKKRSGSAAEKDPKSRRKPQMVVERISPPTPVKYNAPPTY